jgi:general L-amino acid transport system permease protein
MSNMRTRGIRAASTSCCEPAGFDIGEGWLAYDSIDPYWKAFLVGLLNTLRVALAGIVLATMLGTLLGRGPLLAQRAGARRCATATSRPSATSRCCCSC